MYSKAKNLLFTFLAALGVSAIISSCGEDEVIAPTLSYSDATVAVGTDGTVSPTVGGDDATFTILDAGDAEGFVTINAVNGELMIGQESTTGTYEIKVKATNDGGTAEATVSLTIGINPAGFNPAGKSYLWRYFMNQSDGVIFKNLNGLDSDLPAGDIPLAKGWPANWPDLSGYTEEQLFPYLLLDGVQDLIFQVPGDDACSAITPTAQRGDTLLIVVNNDLTISTKCRLKGSNTSGATVELGTSQISYSGGKYKWKLNMAFQGLPIPYEIVDPTSVASFIDPLLGGVTYPALRGTVDLFTTPTNFQSETTILTSLVQIKVDVVLQVLN